MIYHSIQDYTQALADYRNIPLRYDGNNFYSFVNGKWIMDNEWSKSSPSYEVMPKQNPDGTVINLGVMPTKQQR